MAEKSFAVGILAEIIEACGSTISSFAQHLYPVFTQLSKDDDEEVRSNAVFAIGVLMANSGENMYPYPFSWAFFPLLSVCDRYLAQI